VASAYRNILEIHLQGAARTLPPARVEALAAKMQEVDQILEAYEADVKRFDDRRRYTPLVAGEEQRKLAQQAADRIKTILDRTRLEAQVQAAESVAPKNTWRMDQQRLSDVQVELRAMFHERGLSPTDQQRIGGKSPIELFYDDCARAGQVELMEGMERWPGRSLIDPKLRKLAPLPALSSEMAEVATYARALRSLEREALPKLPGMAEIEMGAYERGFAGLTSTDKDIILLGGPGGEVA
jgi:hypothetical protein